MRQRLQHVRRACELREGGVFVFLDRRECGGGGFDHLLCVGKDAALGAELLFFTGLQFGGRDFVDLIFEKIEAQRPILLRTRQIFQVAGGGAPGAECGACLLEQRIVFAVLIDQFAIALTGDAQMGIALSVDFEDRLHRGLELANREDRSVDRNAAASAGGDLALHDHL
ncbi:MAG: hypothetical protein DMF59_05395 [Acidobacteria bacterium]|nr:MAG: hypothetical protein DMF59_05395 [Acidobacteriota bacterium]